MPLLDDQLRARLPPLHSGDSDEEPLVYARFFLPGTNRAWYLMEGEPVEEDFIFFGFISGPDEFGEFWLSKLEKLGQPPSVTVIRDLTFQEGRLTEVVPAPDS